MTDLSQIPAAKLDIPYTHAGLRLADPAEENVPIEIGGQSYTVQNQYLVPHYPLNTGTRVQKQEELIDKLERRFFYATNAELDIPLTGEQVTQVIADYENCQDPEEKQIKANFMAGILVNRIARLARAWLQGNLDGIHLEMPTTDEHHTLTPGQLTQCKKELDEHYLYLITGKGREALQWVRMRKIPDYDGNLLDIIRDLGKAASAPEKKVTDDILRKIGYTMEGIDEAHRALQPLLTDKTMRLALDKACKTALGLTPGQSGSARYIQMLGELADLCRARTGLRSSEDPDNFIPVSERLWQLEDTFNKVHKELRNISQLQATVMHGQQLLGQGATLMYNMALTRLPKNRHSLDIHGEDERFSSIGRLRTDVEQWLASRETGITK